MPSNEDIVVETLKESGCQGQENSISPEDLFKKCADKGVSDERTIEAAIVSLIDQDIIEYEIDDDTLKTTEIWLM